MRAVVQRVLRAKVTVDEETVGAINGGLLVLLGVEEEDSAEDVRCMADKIANLRIFEDIEGKMNHSVLENGGAVLLVSQFTLYGDARKGRRPSFIKAAKPELAATYYECCVQLLRKAGLTVEIGRFQTHMLVELVNDGPVTILLDSKKLF